MKRIVKKVVDFLKREWFLLVMLVVIALIVLVFEWMR
jgi:hypothetical protein